MNRAAYVLAAISLTLLGAPLVAEARDMDVTTHRLFHGTGTSEAVANQRWGSLMSQLAGVVEPLAITPAHSLGMSSFYMGFETGVSQIAHTTDYWRLGSEGDHRATDAGNDFPQGGLTYSRAMFRKGFPFGLDLGLGVGHVYNSSLFIWSGDVKIALFDGWFRKWPAYLPNIAVQGFASTVTGASQFTLTVPGAGVIVSKPIVLGQSVIITPMFNARMSWTMADSEIVWAQGSPQGDERYVYERIRGQRIRLAPGLQVRYQRLVLSGAFLFDVGKGPQWDSDFPAGGSTLSAASQWRIDFGVGVAY